MASFKDAFAAARRSGRKTFSWNGKSYNTKLREEASKASAPTPRARPATASTRSSAPTPRPRPSSRVFSSNRNLLMREGGRKGPSKESLAPRPRNTMGKRRKYEGRMRKG